MNNQFSIRESRRPYITMLATREIVGGQRRGLCACTPGTHINTDNQRVISLCQADDASDFIWHPMIEINLCTESGTNTKKISIIDTWCYDERRLLLLSHSRHRIYIYIYILAMNFAF